MKNLNKDTCIACGKKITNRLILVPNGYGTGYLVFDSFECLGEFARKHDLDTVPWYDNYCVDKLREQVKNKPNWNVSVYGMSVVYELIRKEKI